MDVFVLNSFQQVLFLKFSFENKLSHLLSSIYYQASIIKHLLSSIYYQASIIKHLLSSIYYINLYKLYKKFFSSFFIFTKFKIIISNSNLYLNTNLSYQLFYSKINVIFEKLKHKRRKFLYV
jgi:hypothetical protein